MPPKTIKQALKDMLASLSKEDFDNFCHQLLDRREEPQVRRNKVEGKSRLDITDVLVSTFTESKAAGVAEELLREIGCCEEADRLGVKTKACLDKGDPTFRKTSTRQEALNHAADLMPLQAAGLSRPAVPGKKPEEVEVIQFGQYKGRTFKWLLENDVSYVAYLVASHQQERRGTNQSPQMANKDSLTRYAMAYPEFLKEFRFQRDFQSGQAGEALVGFGRYRLLTLQELYETKDIISYVEFLRTKKSTCDPGSKMEYAIKYILQRDRQQTAAESRKRETKRKWAQSTGGQSTSASRPKQRKPR